MASFRFLKPEAYKTPTTMKTPAEDRLDAADMAVKAAEDTMSQWTQLSEQSRLAKEEAERHQKLVESLYRDSGIILKYDDKAVLEIKSEAREILRESGRCNQRLAEFETHFGGYNTLHANLVELYRLREQASQAVTYEQYVAKLVEVLATGNKLAQLQADIDELRNQAKKKHPDNQSLIPEGPFPAGTWQEVPGAGASNCLWNCVRLLIGKQELNLLPEDDPMRRIITDKVREHQGASGMLMFASYT
jgi:hypothetical protein